jgi:hypothetical protein
MRFVWELIGVLEGHRRFLMRIGHVVAWLIIGPRRRSAHMPSTSLSRAKRRHLNVVPSCRRAGQRSPARPGEQGQAPDRGGITCARRRRVPGSECPRDFRVLFTLIDRRQKSFRSTKLLNCAVPSCPAPSRRRSDYRRPAAGSITCLVERLTVREAAYPLSRSSFANTWRKLQLNIRHVRLQHGPEDDHPQPARRPFGRNLAGGLQRLADHATSPQRHSQRGRLHGQQRGRVPGVA